MSPRVPIAVALTALWLAACSGETPDPKVAAPRDGGGSSAGELAAKPPGEGEYRTIDWDALIPPDWRPDTLLASAGADAIADDSPEAEALMEKLQALWREAPVVSGIDGQKVSLPGFVVPLDMESRSIGEFLLVPYYGACIHVPPPPRNQTVYVVTAKGQEYRGGIGVMDAVLVSGTLKVESQSTEMGDSGYRIDAVKVEPYEPPPEPEVP
jgi:hypothetical protein